MDYQIQSPPKIEGMIVDSNTEFVDYCLEPTRTSSRSKVEDEIRYRRYQQLIEQYYAQLLARKGPSQKRFQRPLKEKMRESSIHLNNLNNIESEDQQRQRIRNELQQLISGLKCVGKFQNITSVIYRNMLKNIQLTLKDEPGKFQEIYNYLCEKRNERPIYWPKLKQHFFRETSNQLHDYYMEILSKYIGKEKFLNEMCNQDAHPQLLIKNIIFLIYFSQNAENTMTTLMKTKQNPRSFIQGNTAQYLRVTKQMMKVASKKLYFMIERLQATTSQIILNLRNIEETQ